MVPKREDDRDRQVPTQGLYRERGGPGSGPQGPVAQCFWKNLSRHAGSTIPAACTLGPPEPHPGLRVTAPLQHGWLEGLMRRQEGLPHGPHTPGPLAGPRGALPWWPPSAWGHGWVGCQPPALTHGSPPQAQLTRQAEPRLVQVAHGWHRDLPRAGRAGLTAAPGLGGHHHLVDWPVIEATGHAVDLRQLRAKGAGCEARGLPAKGASTPRAPVPRPPLRRVARRGRHGVEPEPGPSVSASSGPRVLGHSPRPPWASWETAPKVRGVPGSHRGGSGPASEAKPAAALFAAGVPFGMVV